MRNINDLNIELHAIFSQLKNDTIELKKASEMNNTAGKIISIAKVQLAYAALRGDKPDIAFLQAPTEKLIEQK
jgi:hypothetical protein